MRIFLLSLLLIFFIGTTQAQNTDLPSPASNNQTLPSGSYVIAMDNTNQLNNSSLFNYKAYGLIVTLLNSSKKVKWVIKAGKAKDAIDFTVNASPLIPVITSVSHNITTVNGSTSATVNSAVGIVAGMSVSSTFAGLQAGTTIVSIVGTSVTLSLPATAVINNKTATFSSVTYPVTSYDFKAGPFVIFATDTTGVGAVINTFNSAISNANDRIEVYKTAASVTVDIRYDLTGFIPKGAMLNDGNNAGIHSTFMSLCNIPSANYQTANANDLLTDCYTFASEPHNTNTGQTITDGITAVRRFVEFGGNFLAQCEGIETYENNSMGRFQTTTGITNVNVNVGTAITYSNPDLAFSQFEGSFNISQGGSLQNWRVNASTINNYHKHSSGTADPTVIGASVSKLKSGYGGLVFYIGNHSFNASNLANINGLRMYMNAFLTPVSIANTCTIGMGYMNPLALKLISFQGIVHNTTAKIDWEINENEIVKKFEVERSADGFNFFSAGVVNGTNNVGKETYHYTETMASKRIYYRLKVIYKDETVRYSRTIVLETNADDSQGIKIMSNPVNDRLVFEFKAKRPGPVDVKIIDMLGRVQMKQVITSYEGKNVVNLTLPYAWQNGVYLVEVATSQDFFTAKFLKQ